MGAGGWDYVTEYEGSVEASLSALQARVFAEEFGEAGAYPDLAALWADHEFMGTQGTHTILDVVKVFPGPEEEDGTVRPLPADRVRHHFGTDRPTRDRFEELIARAWGAMNQHDYEASLVGEGELRWSGLYVLLYSADAGDAGDEPTHVGFYGSSGH
ncbi:hypothetical protein ACFXA3_36925 [Streptomyces sp. NPDC059456]|uniref:hypothetical protein n=1 Tax=Streptomyces sp. NPDC059456 TaxID=3346838 RepID=UPI0036ADA015